MRRYLISTLFILWGASLSIGQSRVYWIEGRSDWHQFVVNTGTDGLRLDTLLSFAPSLTGMVVDQHNGYLYFGTVNPGHGLYGSMYRVPLAGGQPEMLLDHLGYVAPGMAIDHEAGKIYWASEGPSWKAGALPLMRANLDGTGVEEWVGDSDGCYGAAIHPDHRAIYWSSGSHIMRANLDGDPDEAPVPGLVTGRGGLTIDQRLDKLYWIWRGDRGSSNFAMIHRARLDGVDHEVVFADSYSEAADIAIDPIKRTLYWSWWGGLESFPTGILSASVDAPVECSSVWPDPTWCSADIESVMETEKFPFAVDLFIDPGAPGLGSPADGASDVSTSTTLTWGAVRCSKRYDVQVSESPEFREMVHMENTPATHAFFVAPETDQTYFWRVQSNACGIAPHWSETRHFTVGSTGPLVARALQPANGASDVNLPPELRWISAPEAVGYHIKVAREPGLSTPLVDLAGFCDTVFVFNDAQPSTTYYWRVAGVDDGNRYTFGPVMQFTTGVATPGTVSLKFPTNGAQGVTPFPEFEWTGEPASTAYDIQIADIADFSTIRLEASALSETRVTFDTPLAYSRSHYWRVRGSNAAGSGPWSDTWGFIVAEGTSIEDSEELPSNIDLGNVYPNPSSGEIRVPLTLPAASHVQIELYDCTGKFRMKALDETVPSGRKVISIDVNDLPAGLYLIIMKTAEHQASTPALVL